METTVGFQIKNIRNKQNLSQTRFGKKIGISGKSISAYETDKTAPPLHVLEKISKAYNVSIFDIAPRQRREFELKLENILRDVNELKNSVKSGLSL